MELNQSTDFLVFPLPSALLNLKSVQTSVLHVSDVIENCYLISIPFLFSEDTISGMHV